MTKGDKKRPASLDVRSKMASGFESAMTARVVAAMWNSLHVNTPKTFQSIDNALRMSNLISIGESMNNLRAVISEIVAKTSKGFLDDRVVHLLEPLDGLLGPLASAFQFIVEAFDTALEQAKPSYKSDAMRLHLVKHHSWAWKMWDAQRSIDGIYDQLMVLDKVFPGLSPWGIIGRCNRRLRKHLRNALYTFETKLEGDGMGNWHGVHEEVKAMLREDCHTGVITLMARIAYEAVKPMWGEQVVTNCRKLVESLSSDLPKYENFFIDINDLTEDVLNENLLATCRAVAEPIVARLYPSSCRHPHGVRGQPVV